MIELRERISESLLFSREIPAKDSEKLRINRLSGLVYGMLWSKSSHLSLISLSLNEGVQAKSNETATSRFLDNKWVNAEEYYVPTLKAFISLAAIFEFKKGIKLVIDGSQMGKTNASLMVSLVWQGRGIPICWQVKEGGKGHFSEKDHLSVLEQAATIIKKLLPSGIATTVLGDGEFDGVDLQIFCQNQGWNYVLRTRCDSVLYENGEKFRPKDVSPCLGEQVFFMPNIQFTERKFCNNFLCWHDESKHPDPIYLVSNLSEPMDIIEFYDHRFSIECLFKDFKSNGFNIHKTQLESAYKITNLILVAALAFVFLAALAFQFQDEPIAKKVSVIRKDKKVLSFFTFALRLFTQFALSGSSHIFFPHFSKNYP